MPDDDDRIDDDLGANERSSSEKAWWAEAVKDLTSAGLATFFMTEDSIRTYLKDKKLPKELAAAFLDGVTRKRGDLYGTVTKEVTRMLSKVDLTREVTRFLESHTVKIEAQIRFEKRQEGEGVSVANISTEETDPKNGGEK